MDIEENFDFSIPEQYRGKEVKIVNGRVILKIPGDAKYLVVNPLEDEEEFLGDQGASDRQQAIYYDNNGQPTGIQNLEGFTTDAIMNELERILVKIH